MRTERLAGLKGLRGWLMASVLLTLATGPALNAATRGIKMPVVPKWSRFEHAFRSSIVYSNALQQATLTVDATFPQQRTGVGAQSRVHVSDAVRLTVQVVTSTWIPRSRPSGYAEITTGDVLTARGPGEYPAGFTFTVNSAYDHKLDSTYVSIIFRDRTGKLIGGAGRWEYLPTDCYPPPGGSHCTADSRYPLPGGTDDSRTEVYVTADHHIYYT